MAARLRKTCWRRPEPGSSGWKKSGNWAEPANFAGNSARCGSRQNRAIFVWCRRIGDFAVNRNYRPTSSGWALVLLSVAVLALGGCGRKAGLDLPPGAPPQAAAAAAESTAPEQPKPFDATPGSGGSAPRAARG